jgi:hypothetical protein
MLLACAVSIVLVAAAVVVVSLASGHRAHPRAPAAGNRAAQQGPAVTEPVQLYAEGTVKVGAGPQAMLAHGNSLWVASPQELVHLNLRNGRTIARTSLPTNGRG